MTKMQEFGDSFTHWHSDFRRGTSLLQATSHQYQYSGSYNKLKKVVKTPKPLKTIIFQNPSPEPLKLQTLHSNQENFQT